MAVRNGLPSCRGELAAADEELGESASKKQRLLAPLSLPGRGAISEEQWSKFHRDGYVNLGSVIPEELFGRMLQRIDDIMMGEQRYPELIMQLDPGGAYGSSSNAQMTRGFKGPTRNYRKIGEAGAGLEVDDVFREAMSLSAFRGACAEVYGAHTDIAVYRAMVFNKPAAGGTDLPWHQDGGDWWGLDRDPLIFVWTALDDASQANGCVRVVPGSHKLGLLSRRGHTLSEARLKELEVEARAVNVEVKAGESILMHNFLLHCSGTNSSEGPRRAFSANYADARTLVLDPRPVVQPENKSAGLLGLTMGARLPLLFTPELPAF